MAIESVTIYRRSVNYWEIIDNTSPEPNGEDAYRGRLLYDGTVTISGANGTVLYNRVPWQAFEYVDEYGSNSFTPTSASDLMQNLINEGFFLAGSGEGGEGATTFLELTDTFPNYFGREGQAVTVNEDGTGLTSVPIEVLESPNLQQVTDSGSETDNPIIVKSEDETRNISYEEDRIVHTNTGGISRITFDEPVAEVSYEVPAKETDDTFAMLSDILSLPITLVIVDANTIQHDRLIGLNTSSLDFPFMIQADNCTWTEYPTDIFPDLEFDPVTGTITGFTIEVGKTAYITINNIAYIT